MAYRLRSLLLTGIVGFTAPLLMVLGVLAGLTGLGLIPTLQAFSETGLTHSLAIIQIFGNGDVLEGLLIISLSISVVLTMFDAYHLWLQTGPVR